MRNGPIFTFSAESEFTVKLLGNFIKRSTFFCLSPSCFPIGLELNRMGKDKTGRGPFPNSDIGAEKSTVRFEETEFDSGGLEQSNICHD